MSKPTRVALRCHKKKAELDNEASTYNKSASESALAL
jgi:hypothetical protein